MGLIWTFLATAGWIAILHEKTDLPAAFCPVAAVAVQVLFLYLLSLLGLLKSGPVILGVMAVLFLLKKRKTEKPLLTPGVVCFCVYAAALWVLNMGRVPDGFDNYSHWALAAKELYLTHALPGPDTLVTMTNYPPAVPLYQYFVLRLAGFSEGAMLGANGIWMGALLSCGFGDCGWRDWKRWPVCAGLMAALTLVIPNCAVNLQVDALMGMTALAMGLLALWDEKKTLPVQGLLGAVLVLTKMSGVMLLVLHCGLLTLLWRRRKGTARELLMSAAWCVGLPGGLYGLFSLRIHRVFADALSRNQFQVGAEAFGGKLAAKSPEFWASFPEDFWRAVWSGETAASLFFLVGNGVLLALLALCLLKVIRLPKGAVGLVLFSWAALAVYTAGLAGMYIFMMDEHESMILASFYRYFGTGVLYQLGLCAFALLPSEDGGGTLPVWLLLLAFVFPCARTQAPVSDWEAASHAARENLRQGVFTARADVLDVWDGETMLYCAYDQTHLNEDYVYRFVRYVFYSRKVRPMGPGLTRPEDLAEGGRCYVLWLGADVWTAQTLADAGLPVPERPGLYYKTAEQTLLPVAMQTKTPGAFAPGVFVCSYTVGFTPAPLMRTEFAMVFIRGASVSTK